MTHTQAAIAFVESEEVFWADVAAHMTHGGYFYHGPEGLFLWRSVRSDWPQQWLDDATRTDTDGDCWFIWLAVGNWRHLLNLARALPPKSVVAFSRRGRAIAHPIAKYGDKTKQHSDSKRDEAGQCRSGSELCGKPEASQKAIATDGGAAPTQI